MNRWLALALALLATPAVAANSSFTLPATTTAYTAGQLMANSATGASVVVPSFSVSAQSPGYDAIIAGGELKVEGKVAELVAHYQANLEQIFLKIVGYEPVPGP